MDKAIPCGLIINELFSNSLKYAFPLDSAQDNPKGEKGKLEISMRRIEGPKSEIELIISDNGVRVPEDVNFENTKTLGMELVNGLTQQLGGTIELYRSNGTKFKITFNI